MNELIEEIIAEIMLTRLLEDGENKHILTRYLSEFPELREEYKDKT